MSNNIPKERWCLQKHGEVSKLFDGQISAVTARIDGIVENVATKFNSLKELHITNLQSVKTALDKSEKELAIKFEHVNKLREEVLEDRATMVKVETYENKVSDFDNFMEEARSDLQTLMTQYDKRTTLATRVSIGALIVSIIIPTISLILLYSRIP